MIGVFSWVSSEKFLKRCRETSLGDKPAQGTQQVLHMADTRQKRKMDTTDCSVVIQRQTAVTAYFPSQQLLLFVFVQQYGLIRQTAVTAYFSSTQLLLFACFCSLSQSFHNRDPILTQTMCYLNSFNARTVFRRQNLTSVDVTF